MTAFHNILCKQPSCKWDQLCTTNKEPTIISGRDGLIVDSPVMFVDATPHSAIIISDQGVLHHIPQ